MSPRKRPCPTPTSSSSSPEKEDGSCKMARMGPPGLSVVRFADHYSSLSNMVLASQNYANLKELGAQQCQLEEAKDMVNYTIWAAEEISRGPPKKLSQPEYKKKAARVNAEVAAKNCKVAMYNHIHAERRGASKDLRVRTSQAFDYAKLHAARLQASRGGDVA